MGFFNWNAADGESLISPYVWIYPVITILVTLFVLACWLFFTRKRMKQEAKFNEKSIA